MGHPPGVLSLQCIMVFCDVTKHTWPAGGPQEQAFFSTVWSCQVHGFSHLRWHEHAKSWNYMLQRELASPLRTAHVVFGLYDRFYVSPLPLHSSPDLSTPKKHKKHKKHKHKKKHQAGEDEDDTFVEVESVDEVVKPIKLKIKLGGQPVAPKR